jgi:hypothetical protein
MTIPGDTRHLTLAELAASGSNTTLPAAAAAHLESCAACRARSRDAVADGVRFLVARCQPPPGLISSVFEAIDTEPAPARPARLPGAGRLPWPLTHGHYRAKRIALATAAAVLLSAAGAGLVTAVRPAGQPGGATEAGGGPITHAGVTLTECTQVPLQVLGRVLERVSGTSLVLAGPLTATTSAATKVLRDVTGTMADVTDGAHVLVIGTVTAGAITGTLVAVMPGTGSAGPASGQSAAGVTQGLAYGTVDDARGPGFTVVEGDGTRIPVTMTASSSVITTVPSSLGELRTGQMTSVVVSPGANGTPAAVTVGQSALSAGALKALSQALARLRADGPGPGLPGPRSDQFPLNPYRSNPVGGPLPSPFPGAVQPRGSAVPGLLPYLLGGSNHPFASLGCDPSAITSVNLLALAFGG